MAATVLDPGEFFTSLASIATLEAVSVVNIDSPTELNSVVGTVVGERRVCYQAVANDNLYTVYYFDSADGAGASAPYVMAASGSGFWIATSGKNVNPAVSLRSTLAVGGLATLTGGLTTPAAITSTLATGTAPFTVASTTVVGNLNVSQLLGKTWAIPNPIGSTTPNTGAFTTLTASGAVTFTAATASSSTTTGTLVVTGGVGVSGSVNVGNTMFASDFAVTGNTNGVDFGHDSASKSMSIGFGAGGTTNFGDIVFYNGKSTGIVRFFGATGALVVASSPSDDGVNKLQIGGSITTTGVYKVSGTQVVGARDTGWTAMTGSPDKATAYATGSVTLVQLAGRVAQIQASLTAHGLLGT